MNRKPLKYKEVLGMDKKKEEKSLDLYDYKLKMLKFNQYITCRSRRFKSADTGIYEIQRSEGIV